MLKENIFEIVTCKKQKKVANFWCLQQKLFEDIFRLFYLFSKVGVKPQFNLQPYVGYSLNFQPIFSHYVQLQPQLHLKICLYQPLWLSYAADLALN